MKFRGNLTKSDIGFFTTLYSSILGIFVYGIISGYKMIEDGNYIPTVYGVGILELGSFLASIYFNYHCQSCRHNSISSKEREDIRLFSVIKKRLMGKNLKDEEKSCLNEFYGTFSLFSYITLLFYGMGYGIGALYSVLKKVLL